MNRRRKKRQRTARWYEKGRRIFCRRKTKSRAVFKRGRGGGKGLDFGKKRGKGTDSWQKKKKGVPLMINGKKKRKIILSFNAGVFGIWLRN